MQSHDSYLALTEASAQALRALPCDVVVTGANGWLGRATLDMLRQALGAEFGQRVVALGSRDDPPVRALESWVPPAGRGLLLWHYAFLTKDRAEGMPLADYERRNRALRERVLGWVRGGSVWGMVLPSSGAVYDYLHATGRDAAVREYGRLKVEDEQAFGAACAQAGARLVIARVFNLSGPYINKIEHYALASMIRQVLAGEPVAVRAARPVLRSYYYVGDCLELCARMLLRSVPGQCEAFDVAGEEVVELGELGRCVAAVLQSPHAQVLRPALLADAEEDCYVGDRTRISLLENKLGLHPLGLAAQIRETARYLQTMLAPLPALG
ncbi:NAD-dependent epimerase/dehydratase family protein [Candidatus Symbiobacter mobilis]|uniref:Nucleoside-diphosphate-sugar epimerase-like protein n=1 Tax=Candidatus Symbiobacter mobilis CR TaxID=946483 RepID=U5N7I4_9BURK|nr:NAD(P)-dependent oxidoreductase [Candidatus Symbiobacter mobilis]AGX87486.1 nucleoside-diphosphate-sugar epimerase-like protein [Candidatus Symbiobacter mobilis CR]